MKRITVLFCLLLISQNIIALAYLNGKLVFKDGSVKEGLIKEPRMKDKYVKFKVKEGTATVKYLSDDLVSIDLGFNGLGVIYERILTYKGTKNKNINQSKSWLKIETRGYVTLYSSIDKYSNTPDIKYWYYYKEGAPAAWYVTQLAINAIVINVGVTKSFIKQSIVYFSDYPELVAKIDQEVYDWEDMNKVVNEYNTWKELTK